MGLLFCFSLTEDIGEVVIFFGDVCEIWGFLGDRSRFCRNGKVGKMNAECLHALKSTESHEGSCTN